MTSINFLAICNPLLVALATINLTGFAWAIRGHFVSGRMPGGMKLVAALSLIGFFAYLRDAGDAAVPAWRMAVALFLQALAGGLFVWAVAATRKDRPGLMFLPSAPVRLFNTGPYRFVRHPFYSSYVMFWLACALATASMVVTATAVALIVIYTAAALQEQNAFLASPFRAQYRAYQTTTGLFWPRLSLWRRK